MALIEEGGKFWKETARVRESLWKPISLSHVAPASREGPRGLPGIPYFLFLSFFLLCGALHPSDLVIIFIVSLLPNLWLLVHVVTRWMQRRGLGSVLRYHFCLNLFVFHYVFLSSITKYVHCFLVDVQVVLVGKADAGRVASPHLACAVARWTAIGRHWRGEVRSRVSLAGSHEPINLGPAAVMFARPALSRRRGATRCCWPLPRHLTQPL